MKLDLILDEPQKKEPTMKNIVRIRTSCFSTKNGVRICKDIYTLKRKSNGYDLLGEEISAMGADYFYSEKRIINLDECEDGIYELGVVNESRDWETGIIDDWDLELFPVKEEN